MYLPGILAIPQRPGLHGHVMGMWLWVLVASEASSPALGKEVITHLADNIAGNTGEREADQLASAGESGEIIDDTMMKRLGGRAVEGERLGGGSDHVFLRVR